MIVDREIFIFIEFADGGSLKGKLEKLKKMGRLMSENQVRIYTRQILSGLEYLHCIKNIFHRDIKLDNILLTSSEQIKISDFGESKYVNISDGTFVGTPAYIAPEIHKKVASIFKIIIITQQFFILFISFFFQSLESY